MVRKIRRRTSARVGLLVLCALILALIGACSSSSGGTAADQGSSSAADIVVGDIGAYSGALASDETAIPTVLNAWADSVNAAGGIDGHHVKVISEDIGQTTGAGLTDAKKLIEQDHVAAIVGDFDSGDTQWVPYAASQGVPVIGGAAALSDVISPDRFPVVFNPITMIYADAWIAAREGGRMGIGYCAEVAACSQDSALVNAFSKSLGITVPVNTEISSSAPDYTAVCQEYERANVTAMLVVAAGSVGQTVADTCYQQGLRVRQVELGPAALPQWKTDPVFDNAIVGDGVAPYFDTSIPGIAKYRAALQKYAPSIIGSENDNSYDAFAWAGGEMFAAALANASGPITAQSVLNGLHKIKNETLGGMIPPVTYTAGKPTINNCFFTWQVSNGNFVITNGGKPTCAPLSVINPVIAEAIKADG